MTLVVAVVAAVVAVTSYVTWIAGRLDRLAVRVEAARGGLDAQLARRAAAAQDLARQFELAGLHAAAQAALGADADAREDAENAENALSRALRSCAAELDPAALHEVEVVATRVGLARQFYNDAVRDLLALRDRPLARLLRLGRGTSPPAYFEIDDGMPARTPTG